jgi:hypothetical protein
LGGSLIGNISSAISETAIDPKGLKALKRSANIKDFWNNSRIAYEKAHANLNKEKGLPIRKSFL